MGNPPPTTAAAQLAHSWHQRYKVGWHRWKLLGAKSTCCSTKEVGDRNRPRQRTQGHPPTQICTSSPVHLTPSWCTNVQGGHHADQIWCTTCTEPHTRKQTSSSIDSDYHPCPPAHQRFFVALGRSPKAAHRKYEYTVGSCYETARLFTHGGHLPRLPHWPDNRQCR